MKKGKIISKDLYHALRQGLGELPAKMVGNLYLALNDPQHVTEFKEEEVQEEDIADSETTKAIPKEERSY